ncbi:Uncharacterised protein [Vibrio cholerae]|nr:Uncharacterised protein [Vibrio cholerae]
MKPAALDAAHQPKLVCHLRLEFWFYQTVFQLQHVDLSVRIGSERTRIR